MPERVSWLRPAPVSYTHLFVAQLLVRADRCLVKELLITGEVDAVTVEDGFLGCGYSYYVELQTLGALQLLILVVNLLEELSADGSYAAYEEIEHLIFGKEERVVYGVERLAQILAVDEMCIRDRSTSVPSIPYTDTAPS